MTDIDSEHWSKSTQQEHAGARRSTTTITIRSKAGARGARARSRAGRQNVTHFPHLHFLRDHVDESDDLPVRLQLRTSTAVEQEHSARALEPDHSAGARKSTQEHNHDQDQEQSRNKRSKSKMRSRTAKCNLMDWTKQQVSAN